MTYSTFQGSSVRYCSKSLWSHSGSVFIVRMILMADPKFESQPSRSLQVFSNWPVSDVSWLQASLSICSHYNLVWLENLTLIKEQTLVSGFLGKAPKTVKKPYVSKLRYFSLLVMDQIMKKYSTLESQHSYLLFPFSTNQKAPVSA